MRTSWAHRRQGMQAHSEGRGWPGGAQPLNVPSGSSVLTPASAFTALSSSSVFAAATFSRYLFTRGGGSSPLSSNAQSLPGPLRERSAAAAAAAREQAALCAGQSLVWQARQQYRTALQRLHFIPAG